MKVLAVGAHPDDVELLCAGTLSRYSKRGDEVTICHACDGGKGSLEHTTEEIAKIRRKEAIESAEIIGADSIWGGFIDGEVTVDLKSRIKVIDIIRQTDPDLIITHSPNDYHADHLNIGKLVFEATYLACIKLWVTDYPNTDTVPTLYYMDTLAGVNFNPSEYVDISDTIKDKVNMMLKMKSQLGFLKTTHNTDAEEFIRIAAKFRGFQAGVAFAEGFVQQQMYPFGLTKRILP
ncbi:MAG: PIG-L family deacetylase [Candidatus Theseobacter exili]|nr:PIG-L family deacetylase [Candidatus Theseobacter exili]